MSTEHDIMVERLSRQVARLEAAISELRIATAAAFNIYPDTLTRGTRYDSVTGKEVWETDAQFEERVHIAVTGED